MPLLGHGSKCVCQLWLFGSRGCRKHHGARINTQHTRKGLLCKSNMHIGHTSVGGAQVNKVGNVQTPGLQYYKNNKARFRGTLASHRYMQRHETCKYDSSRVQPCQQELLQVLIQALSMHAVGRGVMVHTRSRPHTCL